MKKIIILFFINFFLFFCFFFLLEYKVFFDALQGEKHNFFHSYRNNIIYNFENFVNDLCLDKDNISIKFRSNHYNPEFSYDILLLGCSFTYGYFLSDEQTFSYKLQNYNNKNVINRSFPSWGVNNALYLLNNSNFISTIKNPDKIKYVIYVFIKDHVKRLEVTSSFFDDKYFFYEYDKKKDILRPKKIYKNLYWNSYIARLFVRNKVEKEAEKYTEKYRVLLLKHFLQLAFSSKHIFKNSEFIIFVYDGEDRIKSIETQLKDYGINIVYLSELTSINVRESQYIVDKWGHPSERVWDEIVPKLSKRLKLYI